MLQEELESAKQHHAAGRYSEAEATYRRVLAEQPGNAEALHLAGVVAFQMGRPDEAVNLIRQAVAADPGQPNYYCNLGMILAALGQTRQAISSYRHALVLQPDHVETNYNLGIVLRTAGRLEESVNAFRRALAIRPDFAEAMVGLGNALCDDGYLDEAIGTFRQALKLKPDLTPALSYLATALRANGDVAGAIDAYRQALARDANDVEARIELGILLASQRRLEEAVDAFRQAVAARPDHAEAQHNLANALVECQQWDQAIAAARRAIELRPDFPEAYANLGNALQEKGDLDEAVAAFRQAAQLAPDTAYAHLNLANALRDVGQMDEALACDERAFAAHPGCADAMANRIYSLYFHPNYDAAAIFQEHKRWNDQYAQPLADAIQPHTNDPAPERRLRIGYVSPNFRRHVIGQNMMPLLRHHDHEQFEVFCYAHIARPDPLTEQFHSFADVWRDILDLDDEQATELIRSDQIDILVDLTMQMADSRLLVFARKPAPVQVTFAGYPGTTGLRTIDYRLTDPYLDPPGLNDAYYSEQSIRLPDTFWCYDPLTREPAVNELPAASNGYVTFGCLNNFRKVNDRVLQLWSQVLAAVDSRLILMCPRGAHRQGVLAKLGVGEDRVEFVEFAPREQYLRTYHRIDIGLDTLPYNGHTTSLDSLWMGVPVITLVGQTVVGRAGWSQLCNLNLKELAARSEEQFVKLAVGLAGDLPRLAQLRATLRDRMEKSPLMDGERFARNIESTYRNLWRRWCQTKS